ncbi:hypothetical protein Egran_04280 [Elaphomyces granulatus]|uniref:Uncharacterized protein n=1 Tax=Elaphomyces granulatus TaxID=519963 RepID=A0A232LV03_9EURO|nr:hypothetical protein Egran_04280 [Elaphomyces granulatus]
MNSVSNRIAGIIITVSVLVAAGIAVYESPKVRQWMNTSRRKIAIALYNLGDEIHPHDATPQDISMVEEVGEAAEERRRRVREEIMRRASLAAISQERRSTTASFESLVDKDGHLKHDASGDSDQAVAMSTALETSDSHGILRHNGQADPDRLTERRLQAQAELLRAIDRDKIHSSLTSEVSSNHPSESLVDLTPTSEFPAAGNDVVAHTDGNQQHQQLLAQSEFFSVASGASSEHIARPDSPFFYAHPDLSVVHNNTNPFPSHHLDVSSTSSIPGSLSHIEQGTTEYLSDDTLSDLGQPGAGVATPASWSEVGSVISGDDDHHH